MKRFIQKNYILFNLSANGHLFIVGDYYKKRNIGVLHVIQIFIIACFCTVPHNIVVCDT